MIYEDGSPRQIFDAPQRDRTRAFVNRLKVLSFIITSPNCDFIAMSEALQSFGERQLMPRRTADGPTTRCARGTSSPKELSTILTTSRYAYENGQNTLLVTR